MLNTLALRQILSSADVPLTLTACGGGDDGSLPPPSWIGTKQLGVANQIIFGNAVATDSKGNVYVTDSTTDGLEGNTLTGLMISPYEILY
jgi:hypothetical protein